MDFARRQRDPKRHLLGITFVVLFHALVIYAMVTGLARKAVEVIKKPIEVAIIQEVKPPPPPPPRRRRRRRSSSRSRRRRRRSPTCRRRTSRRRRRPSRRRSSR